jgi:Flp pilus assembly protein TadD
LYEFYGGSSYHAKSDYDRAVSDYNRALALAPDDHEARKYLAMILKATNGA